MTLSSSSSSSLIVVPDDQAGSSSVLTERTGGMMQQQEQEQQQQQIPPVRTTTIAAGTDHDGPEKSPSPEPTAQEGLVGGTSSSEDDDRRTAQQQQQQQQQHRHGGRRRTAAAGSGGDSPIDIDATWRLSATDMNFGVPTRKGAQEHVEENHGTDSWRYNTLLFIHQGWVQKTLALLLLLDVLVLFTELYLQATYPSCTAVIGNCIACCPDSLSLSSNKTTDHLRWLSETGGGDSTHHEDICDEGYNDDVGQPSCDEHNNAAVEKTESVLFWITVAILSVFLLENIIEMVTIGPCVFFRQAWFVLDLTIVSVSLSLELFFHVSDQADLEALVGLLIFGRLWRFVRIGHGLIEVAAELTHEKYDEVIEYARAMELYLIENNLPLPETTQRAKDLLIPASHGVGGSEHPTN